MRLFAVVNDPRAITAALVEELRTTSTLPAAEPRSSHRGQSIEVLQRVPPTAAGAADTTRFISLNGLTLDDQTATATSPPPAGEAHRADRPTVLDGREGRKPADGVAEPGQSPPPGGTAEQRRPPPVGGSTAGSGPVPPPRRAPPPAGDETATVNVASPEPKHFLKEKLKNSIRLELRLPVGQRQPRTERQERLVEREASPLSSVAVCSESDTSVGRPRAGSTGSAPASPRLTADDVSLRHSHSSLSIPEATRAAGRRRARGSLPDLAAPALTSLEVGLFGAAGPALLQVHRGRIVARRWSPADAANGGDPADATEPTEATETDPAASSQLSGSSSGGSSAAEDTVPADDSVTRPATDATDAALTLSASESEATDTLAEPSSEPTVPTPPLRLTNGSGRPPRGAGLKARLARLGRPPASVLPPRQFRDPPRAGSSGAESLSKSASLQFGPKPARGASRGGSKSARSSGEFDEDSVYGSLSDIDAASAGSKQKRLSLRMLSGAQSIGSLMARKESKRKRRSAQEAEDRSVAH